MTDEDRAKFFFEPSTPPPSPILKRKPYVTPSPQPQAQRQRSPPSPRKDTPLPRKADGDINWWHDTTRAMGIAVLRESGLDMTDKWLKCLLHGGQMYNWTVDLNDYPFFCQF